MARARAIRDQGQSDGADERQRIADAVSNFKPAGALSDARYHASTERGGRRRRRRSRRKSRRKSRKSRRKRRKSRRKKKSRNKRGGGSGCDYNETYNTHSGRCETSGGRKKKSRRRRRRRR